MARPRKLSPALMHTYTNLDIRHIAYAASYFAVKGDLKAIKSTSVLIRTIVEEWIEFTGGCSVESIDRAYEVLTKLGIAPERTGRVKDRGFSGNTYEDEEEMDKREEKELALENLSFIEPTSNRQKDIMKRALEADKWLAKATEEQLKQAKNGE